MKSLRKIKRVNLINDLPESLLSLEIFSKLHNLRDIIVCKSVSKSWNSIISSTSSLHHKQSFALILNTHPTRCAATNDTSLETWKGFKLNNYIDIKFKSSKVCVFASYRDVLLCMKRLDTPWSTRSQFYLVNPVTMQWTRVPKTTTEDPHCPIGLSGDVSNSNFNVVEMTMMKPSMIFFNVFDSILGKWKEHRVYHHQPLPPLGWCPMQFQALNFNGALHWLSFNGPIIAYNPEFKHRHECRFINHSQQMRQASYGEHAVVSETLTVSMGHLRIIQVVCYPLPDNHHHIVIWTLVDYKESVWKQENEAVYFRDMFSDLPWMQDYMRGYTLSMTTYSILRKICPQPLHCHPENPLLLYLCLPDQGIVSLDVVTKKLRLITRISESDESSSYWNRYDIVTPITLHFNPSLVPDHERVILPRVCNNTFC